MEMDDAKIRSPFIFRRAANFAFKAFWNDILQTFWFEKSWRDLHNLMGRKRDWAMECKLHTTWIIVLPFIFYICILYFGFCIFQLGPGGQIAWNIPLHFWGNIPHLFVFFFAWSCVTFCPHFKTSTLFCKFLGTIFVCLFSILFSFCFLVASSH